VPVGVSEYRARCEGWGESQSNGDLKVRSQVSALACSKQCIAPTRKRQLSVPFSVSVGLTTDARLARGGEQSRRQLKLRGNATGPTGTECRLSWVQAKLTQCHGRSLTGTTAYLWFWEFCLRRDGERRRGSADAGAAAGLGLGLLHAICHTPGAGHTNTNIQSDNSTSAPPPRAPATPHTLCASQPGGCSDGS